MKKQINIVEVGPRDGFQTVKQLIPTEKKLEIVDGIVQAGIKEIEIASFVNPKVIPQMADAGELAKLCVNQYPDVKFSALVPNLRGAVNAWEAGIRHISYVISLSETHNKKNINRTREESIQELRNIRKELPEMNICAGIATIFGCPFEGIPKVEEVLDFVMRLRLEEDIEQFCLADTIGIASPSHVREMITALKQELPECDWQIHIHDTRNMGMVNTLAAIELGITHVQSTLGGLGGCPFAPGASGNTATEDLVYMLENMDYDTGIDFEKLLATAKYQKSFVEGIYSGHHLNIETR